MMKKFFTILGIFLAVNAFADSYYSTMGLGIPTYHVSPQAAGMGGAGIAVSQYLALNEMNPAAVNLLYPMIAGSSSENRYMTITSLTAKYESIHNKYGDESNTTRNGNAAGLQLAIPLYKNRLALLVGLKPFVSSAYFFSADYGDDLDDSAYSRNVKGSGGISALNIGLQFSPLKWLSVGALFGHNFGTYQESWRMDFDEDFYRDTHDEIYTHVFGNSSHLGLTLRPTKNLSVGAIYKPEFTLNADSEIEAGIISGSSNPIGYEIDLPSQKVTYPQSLGFGLAYELPQWLFAVDYYTQTWTDYAVNGIVQPNMQDYYRLSGGFEFVSSKEFIDQYYKRISYRLGAYYAQLPFSDIAGNPIKEVFGTFGMGFPFHYNRGRIDFSIEIGTRQGSSVDPYSERIIRFTGSATGAERWFQRIF